MYRSYYYLASESHRPYEGSQRVGPARWCPVAEGPHHPCEGSQHHCAGRADQDEFLVLIAPRRVRNGVRDIVVYQSISGPHRPYQGSQPATHVASSTSHDVLIALQGFVTFAREGCQFPDQAGPHRPYEGSQLHRPGGAHQDQRPVLIAPTRVRNSSGTARSLALCGVPIALYEGSQHGPRMWRAQPATSAV